MEMLPGFVIQVFCRFFSRLVYKCIGAFVDASAVLKNDVVEIIFRRWDLNNYIFFCTGDGNDSLILLHHSANSEPIRL